jgi:NAD(P)-dependent dehydrogenase (short-subunit alcohol dehydrogenase family)
MDRDKLSRLFDLTDRVAIVTGGTRGIGRAIAEGFVCANAKVVVASRKADACADTQAHLEGLGGEALGVATHMGETAALQVLVDRTIERFGRLDIVVNNAANALSLPVGEFSEDAWEKSLGTNLRGPVKRAATRRSST